MKEGFAEVFRVANAVPVGTVHLQTLQRFIVPSSLSSKCQGRTAAPKYIVILYHPYVYPHFPAVLGLTDRN